MPYTEEPAEVPVAFNGVPVFDTAGAITSVPTSFNYAERIKNNADPADCVTRIKKSFTVDMFVTNKSVTIGGTTLNYRQILNFLKKVGDTERAALP